METSATSKIFEMAPPGSALEKVKLNNMDDTSYAGISSFPLAVANPRHAIWFDHTTAHGSDEYIDCQVCIKGVSQILEFTIYVTYVQLVSTSKYFLMCASYTISYITFNKRYNTTNVSITLLRLVV